MDIFITDINTINGTKLNSFIENNKEKASYANELKKIQHYAGLYLFQYVAKNIYNIAKPKLEFINNKPFLKNNNNLYLSISHSKNIVVAAFEKYLIGIDLEYNKRKRDFLKIAKRCFSSENYQQLKILPETEQQKLFYDLWTRYEADIKLGSQTLKKYYLTDYFIENFTFSSSGEKKISISNIQYINL